MTDAAQFAAQVRRATEDTPYMVTDETADGFTVHIDVVDAQWWTLMHRKSLSTAFKHVVKVKPDGRSYTVTDESVSVRWQAGVDSAGGVPRPVLEASAVAAKGTFISMSSRKEYGMDDDGNVGAVVDYTFDSGEGKRLIDGVAHDLGLTKKINPTALVALIIAIIAVVGAIVAVLVLFITGAFG